MPQKANNQLTTNPQLPPSPVPRPRKPLNDSLIRHAPGRMGLGVEEQLGMDDAIGVRTLEVGPGKGFVVGGVEEDAHADEVVGEEVVEGGEARVALQQGGGGGEGWVGRSGWEADVIGGCEGEEEGRGQSPFDVHVVFAFGEVGEERVERVVAHRGCGTGLEMVDLGGVGEAGNGGKEIEN